MGREKEVLGDPEGSGIRPTRRELYDALTELQSSAAAYVQGLEAENRALRAALEYGAGAAISELVSRNLPTEWSPESAIGVMLAALGCKSIRLDDAAHFHWGASLRAAQLVQLARLLDAALKEGPKGIGSSP